jgi:hypothetical protein
MKAEEATRSMKRNLAWIPSILMLIVFPWAGCQRHPRLQVTLSSDKVHYEAEEPIKLKYEVLWLGDEDANIYMNALTFPELEILYLNKDRLTLQDSTPFVVRSKPGRHEIRTFAPTMEATSDEFAINSSSEPIQFLNGVKGYYVLEKQGSYVIRARFDMSSPWKLSDRQEGTIISNAIVIKVTKLILR